MRRGIVALVMAVFTLSSPAAVAAVAVGTAVGPHYAIDPRTSVVTIEGTIFCSEPANAKIQATLQQRGEEQTTAVWDLYCPDGSVDFTLVFEGFRPGPAELYLAAEACEPISGECDTSASGFFSIRLRPSQGQGAP